MLRVTATLRLVLLTLATLVVSARSAHAWGEIEQLRVPEEIAEGDDLTVLVTASPRETGIDRVLTLQVPDSWKLKAIVRVEAGSDAVDRLAQSGEVRSLFSAEQGTSVYAFADNVKDFDPDAPGIAYFITFSTKPLPGANAAAAATVKTALVERNNPDAPVEIDKKTKKPKPRNTEWRMVYPPKGEFSFAGQTTKKLVQNVHLIRVARTARALVASGPNTTGELKTRPEVLRDFFEGPSSISFWARTTSTMATFLRLEKDDAGEFRIGTGLLGQPQISFTKPKPQSIIAARAIVNDGAWHHYVLSKDSLNKLRYFIDARPPTVLEAPAGLFSNIIGMQLGVGKGANNFELDELRLLRNAYTQPSEFEQTIGTAARDTMSDAFALFHFDEFGSVARSSVPLVVKNGSNDKGEFVPMMFSLADSGVTMTETSSPVQLDPVMLAADLISPTKVTITWHTTSEVGIKQYRLERRIGSFGAFEKVLAVEAKHGLKAPKRGQSIISHNAYTATEELPKLNGDIDLYYRLAMIGYDEKSEPVYSYPIDLQYGADRDVFVEQNQPNPFNPTTNIAFRVTKPTLVRLSIFDIIGREVAVLVNGKVDAGRHVYALDATNWPGGIYFYKVKTAKSTVTRKMVLAK